MITLGESPPSYSTVKKWCHELKLDLESCDVAPRPGRPSTVTNGGNVNRVHDTVKAERRLAIRKILEDIEETYGTVGIIKFSLSF